MTDNQEKLDHLNLEAERAWYKLNAAHRNMPHCEHNIAWQDSIRTAQDNHRKTLAARDRQQRKMGKLTTTDSTGII